MTIEDDIKSAKDAIKKTPSNNATSRHIGRLKAKIARFRGEVQKRAAWSRLQNLSQRSQHTRELNNMSKLDEKYETDMVKTKSMR